MSDAVLIFTFGPVQSFIAEARRTADLFVGSHILSQLATAAAESLTHAGGELVYPASLDRGDTPNKLVVRLPFDRTENAAEEARRQLLARWQAIADQAHDKLSGFEPAPDKIWEATWQRQVSNVWEVHWAAARMESGTPAAYARAYREASDALAAVKRTRAFEQVEEPGDKDSLSGRREALHLNGHSPMAYWKRIGTQVTATKLRPEGRERLDAIGAVKRFCDQADKPFPSTSTVAAADFLRRACADGPATLRAYRGAVKDMLGSHIYWVSTDPEWPYDGDLLFEETLQPERLADSYGVRGPNQAQLEAARSALRRVYDEVETRPRPYYAIIASDGDNMGRAINNCLIERDPQTAHRAFSQQLADFAGQVATEIGEGFRIYNGGDDVLALSPLSSALPTAQRLAEAFKKTVAGCTASAGIAIAHHLYPLDAVLMAARAAEAEAKRMVNKGAVCVRVIKRSGETFDARSRWSDMGDLFQAVVSLFAADQLAGRAPYELLAEAAVLGALDDGAQRACLRRLIKRHSRLKEAEAEVLATRLADWAFAIRAALPTRPDNPECAPNGLVELARWLIVARFVAQGGAE